MPSLAQLLQEAEDSRNERAWKAIVADVDKLPKEPERMDESDAPAQVEVRPMANPSVRPAK